MSQILYFIYISFGFLLVITTFNSDKDLFGTRCYRVLTTIEPQYASGEVLLLYISLLNLYLFLGKLIVRFDTSKFLFYNGTRFGTVPLFDTKFSPFSGQSNPHSQNLPRTPTSVVSSRNRRTSKH